MAKAEAEAIIKALQASIDFLVSNGIAIRQPISDATADASHVAGLIATYDSAIETIINDIPDDEVPDDNA